MTEIAGIVAAAAAAATMLRASRPGRPWMELLAAVPALTLGALSLATFALLLLDLPTNALSVALGCAAVLAYIGLLERRWQARQPAVPAGAASPTRLSAPVWGLLLLTAGALVWAGHRWIHAWPHGAADAVNIWTSRGLLLARADGDIPQRLAVMTRAHPHYPLLLPTVLAAQYRAVGSEPLLIPQATSVVWLLGVVAATYAVAARFSNAAVGALAALAVAANPLLVRWAFVQCADVPVAYLLLLSAGSGAALLAGGGCTLFSPLLAGFFVGLLMWTKQEGLAAAAVMAVLAAAWLLVAGSGVRTLGRRAAFFALGIAPAAAALLLFRTRWVANVSEPSYLGPDWIDRLTDVERWRVILSTGAYEAFFSGRMNVSAATLLCLLAVVLTLLALRRVSPSPAAGYLLAVPLAMAPIYTAAYLLSPYPLQWHVSTSIDRLLLQLMPTTMVASALILAAASGRPAPTPSGAGATAAATDPEGSAEPRLGTA